MFDNIFRFLTESLKLSGPLLILALVLGYFLKLIIEKRIDKRFTDLEEIAKSSLGIKSGLRESERNELVNFRVVIEEWQHFLEASVFDFAILDRAKADIPTLYEKDSKLFLAVRIAAVKASTYLRKRDLEAQLLGAIIEIRKTYYPLIDTTLPKLIDLKAQLAPIDYKLKAFEQSGFKDMTYAPTPQDRDENLRLQSLMTAEVAAFRDNLLSQYRTFAEQMNALKEAINVYIYRPIQKTDIDKE